MAEKGPTYTDPRNPRKKIQLPAEGATLYRATGKQLWGRPLFWNDTVIMTMTRHHFNSLVSDVLTRSLMTGYTIEQLISAINRISKRFEPLPGSNIVGIPLESAIELASKIDDVKALELVNTLKQMDPLDVKEMLKEQLAKKGGGKWQPHGLQEKVSRLVETLNNIAEKPKLKQVMSASPSPEVWTTEPIAATQQILGPIDEAETRRSMENPVAGEYWGRNELQPSDAARSRMLYGTTQPSPEQIEKEAMEFATEYMDVPGTDYNEEQFPGRKLARNEKIAKEFIDWAMDIMNKVESPLLIEEIMEAQLIHEVIGPASKIVSWRHRGDTKPLKSTLAKAKKLGIKFPKGLVGVAGLLLGAYAASQEEEEAGALAMAGAVGGPPEPSLGSLAQKRRRYKTEKVRKLQDLARYEAELRSGEIKPQYRQLHESTIAVIKEAIASLDKHIEALTKNIQAMNEVQISDFLDDTRGRKPKTAGMTAATLPIAGDKPENWLEDLPTDKPTTVWRSEGGRKPYAKKIKPNKVKVIEGDQYQEFSKLRKQGKLRGTEGKTGLSYPQIDVLVGEHYRRMGYDFLFVKRRDKAGESLFHKSFDPAEVWDISDPRNIKWYTPTPSGAELYAVRHKSWSGAGQDRAAAMAAREAVFGPYPPFKSSPTRPEIVSPTDPVMGEHYAERQMQHIEKLESQPYIELDEGKPLTRYGGTQRPSLAKPILEQYGRGGHLDDTRGRKPRTAGMTVKLPDPYWVERPKKAVFKQGIANAIYGGDISKVQKEDMKHFAKRWKEFTGYLIEDVIEAVGIMSPEELVGAERQMMEELNIILSINDAAMAEQAKPKPKFEKVTTSIETGMNEVLTQLTTDKTRTTAALNRALDDARNGPTPAARNQAAALANVARKNILEIDKGIAAAKKRIADSKQGKLKSRKGKPKGKGKGKAGLFALLGLPFLDPEDREEGAAMAMAGGIGGPGDEPPDYWAEREADIEKWKGEDPYGTTKRFPHTVWDNLEEKIATGGTTSRQELERRVGMKLGEAIRPPTWAEHEAGRLAAREHARNILSVPDPQPPKTARPPGTARPKALVRPQGYDIGGRHGRTVPPVIDPPPPEGPLATVEPIRIPPIDVGKLYPESTKPASGRFRPIPHLDTLAKRAGEEAVVALDVARKTHPEAITAIEQRIQGININRAVATGIGTMVFTELIQILTNPDIPWASEEYYGGYEPDPRLPPGRRPARRTGERTQEYTKRQALEEWAWQIPDILTFGGLGVVRAAGSVREQMDPQYVGPIFGAPEGEETAGAVHTGVPSLVRPRSWEASLATEPTYRQDIYEADTERAAAEVKALTGAAPTEFGTTPRMAIGEDILDKETLKYQSLSPEEKQGDWGMAERDKIRFQTPSVFEYFDASAGAPTSKFDLRTAFEQLTEPE